LRRRRLRQRLDVVDILSFAEYIDEANITVTKAGKRARPSGS
jgi:hypothetical protein